MDFLRIVADIQDFLREIDPAFLHLFRKQCKGVESRFRCPVMVCQVEEPVEVRIDGMQAFPQIYIGGAVVPQTLQEDLDIVIRRIGISRRQFIVVHGNLVRGNREPERYAALGEVVVQRADIVRVLLQCFCFDRFMEVCQLPVVQPYDTVQHPLSQHSAHHTVQLQEFFLFVEYSIHLLFRIRVFRKLFIDRNISLTEMENIQHRTDGKEQDQDEEHDPHQFVFKLFHTQKLK